MASILHNRSVDLSGSIRARFYVPVAIVAVLTYFTVGLRLWSRRLTRRGLDASDYLAFIALFFFTLLLVLGCVGVENGVADDKVRLDILDPTYTQTHLQLKLLVASTVLYMIGITFAKLSFLLLCRRVFGTPGMRRATLILGIIVVAISIAIILVNIFGCRPIENRWLSFDQRVPGCVINLTELCVFSEITKITTDLACILLPIHQLKNINLGKRDKATIAGYFLTGGFAVLFSVPRAIEIEVSVSQGTVWRLTQVDMWTLIETGVGIISVCLPVLRPVVCRITGATDFESRRLPVQVRRMPTIRLCRKKDQAYDDDDHILTTDDMEGRRRRSSISDTPVPSWPCHGSIRIERSFEIQSVHNSRRDSAYISQETMDHYPGIDLVPRTTTAPKRQISRTESNAGSTGSRKSSDTPPATLIYLASR